jgi:hypothetical protein
MTALAAILSIALAVTLFFLVVIGIGSAQMLDAERKLTDRYKAERDEARAARRVVEAVLRAEQRAHQPRARSIFTNPAAERITNILAANEAGRFDPDAEDWGRL